MTDNERPNVLIVDDSLDNIELLGSILDKDHDISFASNGAEGLALAADYRTDLILLDVVMPGIDGFEVCRRLKADIRTHDIPVIFLTSLESPSDEEYGLSLGAEDFIHKPVSPPVVLARIRNHLLLAKAKQELKRHNEKLEQLVDERTREIAERNRQLVAAQSDSMSALRALADAQRSLEEKVVSRTSELQEVNREQAVLLERLQTTQAQLVQSEKLAALGALVSGIAHELGTPIGNALMIATTIDDQRKELERELREGIRRSVLDEFMRMLSGGTEILLRNLQRVTDLVMSFKEVAIDRTSSRRRQFDLNEVVRETQVALAPTLRHSRCSLTSDIPQGIVLDSFPGPLGQVLGNLISNSIIHGFEGAEDGEISIRAEPGTDGVTIHYSDNGCGIPADDLPKVFDPFFTTKLGRGGSGLGLNIVYTIVTGILGGTIRVTSTIGKGAEFHIEIPCVAPSDESTD